MFEQHISKTQKATLVRYRTQLQRIAHEIAQNRSAMIALVIIIGFVFTAIFAPIIAPHDPKESFQDESGLPLVTHPPTAEHPLGTNSLGRDLLSQWIFGARVSVLVGVFSGFAVMFIGTVVGLTAGYYKGKVDLVLMRVVDILYGIPATPLILVLALFYGNSVWVILFAYVLVLWRTMARLIRVQTMSLSERPFVKSARAAGASNFRIMFIHILPNLLPLVFIQTTFTVSLAIVLEAGISFLGVGAELSWGSMLQLAFQTGAIGRAWWWVIPPGISITALVLAFFFLSRSLEDISNPEVGGIG